MPTAKKPTPKAGAAKKSAAAPKKRATDKKPAATPAKKSAPAKPAAKPVGKIAATVAKVVSKIAAKPAPPAKSSAKEKATSAPPAPPSRPTRGAAAKPEKVAGKRAPGRAIVVKAGTAVATKLGTKWNCFKCAARFYDLNKPEPLCPKCGADQRQRPKVAPPPSPAPAAKKQPRPMAPLLEDEDDGSVRYDEDIDLGVRTEIDEPDEELFQPGEYEEDEPFGGPEED